MLSANAAAPFGGRSLSRVDAGGVVLSWPVPVPAGSRVFDLVQPADLAVVADALWAASTGSSRVVRVSCRLIGERAMRHWYLTSDGAGGIEGAFFEPVRPEVVLPPRIAGPLTRRERQVASLLVSGWRPDEAATELGISRPTLRNHLKYVYAKLGVHGQRELMLLVDQDSVAD